MATVIWAAAGVLILGVSLYLILRR